MDKMPNFIKSPFFVPEFGNWHLKDGAPKEVVDEFNEYMKNDQKNRKEGRTE